MVGGRIAVQGVKFHAEADAVRYEEGKGLLTLESTETQPVVLWRRLHGGKEEQIFGVRILCSVKRDVVSAGSESITR